ncbi:TrkH family potassium uptake protein [Capnocytophaga stomatis]|uniref:TrkH family potassium uptake protein n=2 Tax=Capnocytophaga stomatis TaxID=1848904 RepID=A0ABW8QEM0_9FLAO|nr:potassium transporter TrkG [Capnocytophaga stomatis]GIJ94949.1 potassium transporter [Capnocytophaga stomatis]GIM49680.1 potassium transporter [Capnocytophaga stomatis]
MEYPINKSKLKTFFLVLHILLVVVLIADYGYSLPLWLDYCFLGFYTFSLVIAIFFHALKLYRSEERHFRIDLLDGISIAFIIICLYEQFIDDGTTLVVSDWMRWATILVLIRGANLPKIGYKRSVLNPAQLFIISFIGLIGVGTFLLMLPNSTYGDISLVDALFTSTSAVCVTGLSVVDIGTYFTRFGQTIIMLLIQAGGLGILTFASYFSYFFKEGATYENQIALSDITDSKKIGEVFTTLRRILVITFTVEIIGAFLIFININPKLIPQLGERIYFSIFHSVSAFCNAGFSTLSNGMMEAGFVTNYRFQLTIITLFVFGGLGFPIVINTLRYLKHLIKRYFLFFVYGRDNYIPWILTLSSKINLITTSILIVAGTGILYLKEYSSAFASHSGIGKFVTALFTATTPRTAGFNTIDFNQLQFSSIILIILLMWVGASPASTGGGIKTSTFAIGTLNFLSLAKGKKKIELFRREIADISVRRAFAVMSLSFIVIGAGIFLISDFDNNIELLDIAFECFSAYSTTGLSLGITGLLSDSSKVVLVGMMFVGRVSMLTILIAVFRKSKTLTYRYPGDEILIN